MITIAVGDIHGQLEPLKEVLRKCLIEAAHQKQPFKFVFIGDYIDRGPDSKGVVDYLMLMDQAYECVFLRGNHEDMFLFDPANMYGNGGEATLKSYGWNPVYEKINNVPELKDWMKDNIPQSHWDWFRNTKLFYKDELRTFVHAGIKRWNGGIENQSENAMLWIRDEFLHDDSIAGGYVVHGHTPTIFENGDTLPIVKKNRLNIDTGAAYGGKLTAAFFVEDQVEATGFYQVPVVKEGPYK